MYDMYIENPGFGILNPLIRLFFKILIGPLRRADLKAAGNPDYYVTISEYAKEQIKKYYKRESFVIHPPVDFDIFTIKNGKSQIKEGNSEILACGKPVENYFIVTSRQVNWKRIDLAIKACIKTRQTLLIIGEGSEHMKLRRIASGHSDLIHFIPLLDKYELKRYLMGAKGYLFPSLEPFGIAPVEALAVGCPVIAYKDGGSRDYIIDGVNGLLFPRQSVDSLVSKIKEFEKMKFDKKKVAKSVEDYGTDRFEKEVRKFVDGKIRKAL